MLSYLVFSNISTERLLCMEYLEGKKLLDFKNKSHGKKTLAKICLRLVIIIL